MVGNRSRNGVLVSSLGEMEVQHFAVMMSAAAADEVREDPCIKVYSAEWERVPRAMSVLLREVAIESEHVDGVVTSWSRLLRNEPLPYDHDWRGRLLELLGSLSERKVRVCVEPSALGYGADILVWHVDDRYFQSLPPVSIDMNWLRAVIQLLVRLAEIGGAKRVAVGSVSQSDVRSAAEGLIWRRQSGYSRIDV
jgi:hypothetical protein